MPQTQKLAITISKHFIGYIFNFDSSLEEWKCYDKLLEQFFMANDVPNK